MILKKKKDLNKFLNYYICIYPCLLLINTQLILNFFNIILLGVLLIKAKKEGYKVSFLEKWIVLFLICIIISFIGAPYKITDGLRQVGRILRWIFFPLLLGQININKETKAKLIYSVGIGIFIYAIKFFLDYKGILSNRYGLRYSGGYKISQISLVLGICTIIGVIFLFYYKNLTCRERILLSIITLMSLVMLILTQTRGMYLSLSITLLLAVWVKSKIHCLYAAITIIMIGGIFYISYPNNKYVVRAKNIVKLDNSNKGRIEVWKESYRIFIKNPVNGVGFHNFSKVQNKKNYKINRSGYTHSHNTILKFLAETGIIGFLGYICLFIKLIVLGLKKAKQELNYLILLSVVLCLFFYENTDVLIQNNFAYPFIYFIIGVVLNSEYKKLRSDWCVK